MSCSKNTEIFQFTTLRFSVSLLSWYCVMQWINLNYNMESGVTEEGKNGLYVVTKQTRLSMFRLNHYSEANQTSRGLYASSNGTARVGGRQDKSRIFSDSDSQDKRSRISFSRPSMQTVSSQSTKGSSSVGQDGPPAPCQLISRKPRNVKQPDPQSLPGSSLPHRDPCPEDPEYASLIGAMDNDLDRPESLGADALQERSSRSIQNKGTTFVFN